MTEQFDNTFLDVPALLELSLPRSVGLVWRSALSREQQQLVAVEELIRLRRWPEAAGLLENLLSRPMRTPQGRVQALVYLAAVLARFHRFADAVAVYDYLLRFEFNDEEMTHGLRLGRAMSLLHEERLFDADRAINELRRQRGGEPSAGLCLVEIYRDVKTGHPQEAVDLFEGNLTVLRNQLGNRVADAWALAARAFDLLGREAEAKAAYEKATLLVDEEELGRRYAEVASLCGKYPPSPRPREAA
jgi:tetratricopeptide (TPR) repeat protein